MAEVGDRFIPGEPAPTAGTYECERGDGHRWVTEIAGRVLPPLPCFGDDSRYWVLYMRADT